MSVHDELEAALAAGRWADLRPYLLAAQGSEIHRAAQAWHRERREHWFEHHRWRGPDPENPALDGPGTLRALALAFRTPAQAARELGQLTVGWRRAPSDGLAVAAALARGADFCQAFLDAASRLPLGREDVLGLGWVARLGLPMVESGMAQLPDGPTFGRSWAALLLGPGPEGSLVEELRETPVVADVLAAALATPEAFADFDTYRWPGRDLGQAVAQVVTEGLLDRDRVVASVLEALTRSDGAASQRALARLLSALDLDRDDAAERLPLLLHLLASARGPVTGVLLPPVTEAVGDDALPGLAATVFARPEKAQRTTLLRALTARDAPWGQDARVQALTVAAALPDQALADRAARALSVLGAAAAPPAAAPHTDLWADPPPVPPAGPATVVEPDEASMTAALSRMTVAMDPSDGAMFWDGAVRWHATDRAGAAAWAATVGRPGDDRPRPAGMPALQAEPWHRVDPASHRRLRTLTERLHTGVRGPFDSDTYDVTSPSSTQALHRLLMSETALRLGKIPCVLSTPTRTDGTLELAALTQRLREYAAGRQLAGPVDLFVALLRLTETDPGRVVELAGLEVDLWSEDETSGVRALLRRSRSADAVQLVRDWVGGGGLPRLRVSHHGGLVDVAPPTLPVPVEAFGGIPPSLLAGHQDGVHVEYADWLVGAETDAGLVPGWADLLAARMQRTFDQAGRFAPLLLPAMAASPRPGPAVIHAVTATLSHADEDRRLVAVEAALTLMARGLWHPDDHTTCCEHLLAEGQLRLGRLAHSWEQVILAGGLKPLWPTAVAVLARACALERKPTGLAELLGMLRRYVGVVPDVVVPEPVVALASSTGSSKARAQAAAFVQAAAAGTAAEAAS